MTQSATLDAIGLKHGTDKASSHHGYLPFYEQFFGPLRNKQVKVLEIGVFNGASLKTWEDYFPNADIIGVDIAPGAKQYDEGRVTIVLADQSNVEEMTRLGVERGPFDIIIEDGSHQWNHQVTTLRTLFPFLKNDGLYVVEDLQTNYGPMQESYKGAATSTCIDYLKTWLDLRVADEQIPINDVEDAFLRTYGRGVAFITFCRHACLIKKHVPPVTREVGGGVPLFASDTSGHAPKVTVLAHVGFVGDVFGPEGYVNAETRSLQGFSVRCNANPLEYRVRFADGSWSDWTANGAFAGTRGKSLPVTAFTFRHADEAALRYLIRSAGRFIGTANVVEAAEGQDCSAPDAGALCGIQVQLIERSSQLANE